MGRENIARRLTSSCTLSEFCVGTLLVLSSAFGVGGAELRFLRLVKLDIEATSFNRGETLFLSSHGIRALGRCGGQEEISEHLAWTGTFYTSTQGHRHRVVCLCQTQLRSSPKSPPLARSYCTVELILPTNVQAPYPPVWHQLNLEANTGIDQPSGFFIR
jgi:hypothetical protein